MSFVNLIGYGSWLEDVLDAKNTYGSMNEPTYVVGSAVHYAIHVEYGTYKMPSQPHLRPATDAVQGNIDKYFRTAATIDGALKKAATDLATRVQRETPVDTGRLRASYAPPVKL